MGFNLQTRISKFMKLNMFFYKHVLASFPTAVIGNLACAVNGAWSHSADYTEISSLGQVDENSRFH